MVLVWKETVEAYHCLNSVTEWMPASGLCFSTCCFRLHYWISAQEYKVKEENTIWSSHILGADSLLKTIRDERLRICFFYVV